MARLRPGALVASAHRDFLHSLHQLALAADAIGEADEAARCAELLRDCDPAAGDALAGR